MIKHCGSCQNFLPVSFFGKRAASNDGLSSKCKDCQRKYDKERANLPHRVKAREDYAKSRQGKLAGSKAKKEWIIKNLIKRSANIMVGNAVRDGKLAKPSNCECCKQEHVRLHGHHDDYAFPLIVRWLCPRCHNKWHKENGEGKNAK